MGGGHFLAKGRLKNWHPPPTQKGHKHYNPVTMLILNGNQNNISENQYQKRMLLFA